MEEETKNTIFESRNELMISSTDQENPTFRTAHFLKPSITSNLEESCNFSSFSLPSVPNTFQPHKWPLTINFHGWKHPLKRWKEWVEKMESLHEFTWRKAGIHEAILNSTYNIQKNSDLILGVAERWCRETKSFIFPWGEATITLEDMLISGYSVLGCPVSNPLETEEFMETKEKLIQARRELVRTPAKKASQHQWLNKFIDSGGELEHEAFLSLWLSRFVLPISHDVISECVFSVAIHLARGTRIALAPAVLASIYRDLTLLRKKIAALSVISSNEDTEELEVAVTIWSPFQLVQVWIWERFMKLQPKPNLMSNGEPRLALWNNLISSKFDNLRLVLDSSKESFAWRPYTKPVKNWEFPKFYREEEMWVSMNSCLDEELESFILCLRVSELVGMGVDCIEQYLPHRVARQLGFDQDIPDFVARSSKTQKDAWSCYNRAPISDEKCYIPSRYFETDVTTRYLDWWKHSVSEQQKSSASHRRRRKLSKEPAGKTIILDSPEKSIEDRDSNEEDDDMIIDQWFESRKKATKVSPPAASAKSSTPLSTNAVIDLTLDVDFQYPEAAGKDEDHPDSKNAVGASLSDDHDVPFAVDLTFDESLNIDEPAEAGQDGNSIYASCRSGKSRNGSLSGEDNDEILQASETPHDFEVEEASAPKTVETGTVKVKQEAEEANESRVETGNKEGKSGNSLLDQPAIKKLKDRIGMLEKIVAARKAVLYRKSS